MKADVQFREEWLMELIRFLTNEIIPRLKESSRHALCMNCDSGEKHGITSRIDVIADELNDFICDGFHYDSLRDYLTDALMQHDNRNREMPNGKPRGLDRRCADRADRKFQKK